MYNFNSFGKSVCKLTKYMCKLNIFTEILQGNVLFSGKIYTTGNNFTRPPVATVATNSKSGGFHRHCKDKFQISFYFKDIFAQENPLSDFTIQFDSNYLTTFKAWL